MNTETHIASAIVLARPERLPAVLDAINALDGAEIHAATPEGKVILTLETDREQEILNHLNAISLLDGVLSATLVFHHVARPEDLEDAE